MEARILISPRGPARDSRKQRLCRESTNRWMKGIDGDVNTRLAAPLDLALSPEGVTDGVSTCKKFKMLIAPIDTRFVTSTLS